MKLLIHHEIEAAPSSATLASVDARSHHGASMPPAIQEQPPSPSALPRSTTSTAAASPATPAPTTMTLDSLTRQLPFLRRNDPDQVQRVQPLSAVSDRSPCGNRSPLGLSKETAGSADCQATDKCADSPKLSLSGWRTSLA